MSDRLAEKAAAVRLLTLDVDGVQTDGGLYYTEAGDVMRRFNVRDGMGIKRVQAGGVRVYFVTQSVTPCIAARAKALGIDGCLDGVHDKLTAVKKLCADLSLNLSQVAHMGDDVNDLELLGAVGFPATVADAVPEVAAVAIWRSGSPGGAGAVREFCEFLLQSASVG